MDEALILKMRLLVLSLCVPLLLGACSGASPSERIAASENSSDYSAPQVAGKIETNDIKESSGLAASGCQSDVLWTHEDAGNDAVIFGMSTTGKHLGTWKVQNAENIDWEDIAAFKDSSGKCFLIIGDIGNNKEDRSELTIYRVPEPTISPGDARSDSEEPVDTAGAESMRFRYSDQPSNAEAMMVRPGTGDIYILTKQESGPSRIHKLTPSFGSRTAAVTQKIGEISVPATPIGLLTGGAISPDGRRVALCDYKQGYELVLPADASNFDAIWQQRLVVIDLGKRKQGEGITYSPDGNALYASSENKNAPLMRVQRR